MAERSPALIVAWPDSRKISSQTENETIVEPRIRVEPVMVGVTLCSSLKRFHFSDPFRDHRLFNLLDNTNETVISTNISSTLTYNGATTLQNLIQYISP